MFLTLESRVLTLRRLSMGVAFSFLVGLASLLGSQPAHAAACGAGTAPSEGTGTSNDPFKIASKENLIWVSHITSAANTDATDRAAKLAAHYLQTAQQIDLEGCEWASIGVSSSESDIFQGVYSGGTNAIVGLFVDHTVMSPSGLFGAIGGPGTVEDLTIAGRVESTAGEVGGVAGYVGSFFNSNGSGAIVNVTSSVDVVAPGQNWVGGLVGVLSGGTIEQSRSSGTVSGNTYVGGLVGNHQGEVRLSVFSGTLTGIYGVGGIAGYSYDGDVVDSTSQGAVTQAGDTGDNPTGGVVGYMDELSTISGSGSTGPVSAEGNQVGGLVGFMEVDTEITRSHSHSTVGGRLEVGGLVGFSEPRNPITYSYATGDVSGALDVGGFVGGGGARISDSYASGRVEGDDTVVAGPANVGGLFGDPSSDARFVNSYSRGLVVGPDPLIAGGLLGDDTSRTATASFWDTETSQRTYSAGGEAKNTAEMTSFSTFSAAGWDIVQGWVAWAPTATPARVWGICSGVNLGYPFLLWEYDSNPCPPASSSVENQATTTTETRSDAPAIHLDLQVSVGQQISGAPVVIGGQGLAGGSAYTLTVRSTPQVIEQGTASALGNFSKQVSMPALSAGSHTLTLSAVAPNGSVLTLVQGFTIGSDGTVTALGTPAGSSGSALAATGPDQLVMLGSVGLAMLMMVLGASALAATRARKNLEV